MTHTCQQLFKVYKYLPEIISFKVNVLLTLRVTNAQIHNQSCLFAATLTRFADITCITLFLRPLCLQNCKPNIIHFKAEDRRDVWCLVSFAFTCTEMLSLQNFITEQTTLWENNYFVNTCIVLCMPVCVFIFPLWTYAIQNCKCMSLCLCVYT